jgi:L-ascorbate metabolism protein UlaG (beta-lactamase superfamily)
VGRFDERATKLKGFPVFLKWQAQRLLGAARDTTGFRTPWREGRVPEGSSLTWIGHASFVLRLGGKVLAIDPVWSTRVGGVVKRHAPPGVPLDALPPVDVVLVTHDHMDHMDFPTLEHLAAAPLAVTPVGNGDRLRKLGYRRVVELDWWQAHAEGPVAITLVPAKHWSMRAPWTRNDALWGGFVLAAPEGTVYHSGDTAWFDGFAEIGARHRIDWALLPIGAYHPRWFFEPQHMDPDDALRAFEALGAKNFVAMHWGTFRLTDEPLGEPPERLRAGWNERGLDPSRLWILDVGESRPLA